MGTPTFPAVTENVPELTPAGMVTDPGMFTSAGDCVRVIVAPPLGAFAVKVTVQSDDAGGVIVTGLHEKPFKPGGCKIVTTPPLIEVKREVPVPSAANPTPSCTCEDVLWVEAEIVITTLATTPFCIGVEVEDQTRHVIAPAVVLHETAFPAPVDAGPAVTTTEEKSVVE